MGNYSQVGYTTCFQRCVNVANSTKVQHWQTLLKSTYFQNWVNVINQPYLNGENLTLKQRWFNVVQRHDQNSTSKQRWNSVVCLLGRSSGRVGTSCSTMREWGSIKNILLSRCGWVKDICTLFNNKFIYWWQKKKIKRQSDVN